MRKSFIACLACLVFLLTWGFTPLNGQSVTRESADSLLRVVQDNRKDLSSLKAMLQLSQFYILKPFGTKTDLDSCAGLIERARALNGKLRSRQAEGYIFLQESNLYKKKGQMALGKQMAEKAVDRLKTEDSPELLGKSWLALSEFYSYEVDNERMTRIGLVKKALGGFEKAGNKERQAYSLEVLTDLYSAQGDYPVALKYGILSVQKYDSTPNANKTGVYILIASTYRNRDNLDSAVKYCLKALRSAESVHDSSMTLCQINNITGLIYNDLHEDSTAAVYMKTSLTVAERFRDTVSVLLVASNLADIDFRINRTAQALALMDEVLAKYGRPKDDGLWGRYLSLHLNAYRSLKQFDKAAPYCDNLLTFADRKEIGPDYSSYLYNQAMSYYLDSRQYDKGRALLPKLEANMVYVKSATASSAGYFFAFRLDTAQHLYRSAIANLLRRDVILDTILSERKNKEIQKLKIEYETAEKEKNIEILQKEGQLQNRSLEQSRQTRNYSIAGSVLLLLLLALAINRYRLKQRTNIQLQLKQKEISEKNVQLERLLQENEWLFREVHHRVKNNLQTVMSLLNSQSLYLKDERAVSAVVESRNRVQAMSLIHQKLYKTNNVSTINMPEYITDLVDYLKDSLRADLYVNFELDITSVNLDVLQAVPLGLILNEVITNSFKYAFPDRRQGKITVRLSVSDGSLRVSDVSLPISDGRNLTLYIADNGVGMLPDLNQKTNSSFGMLLIHGLVEDLEGTIEIETGKESGKGTAYTISFLRVEPGERMLRQPVNFAATGSI